jgi:hypothetical protein
MEECMVKMPKRVKQRESGWLVEMLFMNKYNGSSQNPLCPL